jgi:hypothetical protein
MEQQEKTEQEKKREFDAAVVDVTKLLKRSTFFINIAILDEGAQIAVMGPRKELLMALLHSDTVGSSILLEQLTNIRSLLGDVINDFLDVKEEPNYKVIKDLMHIAKLMHDKRKQSKDETRND